MTRAFGVDLGNTRCKTATIGPDGKPVSLPNGLGESTSPSAFLMTQDGECIFGQEALNSALLEPEGFVSVWKQRLGDPEWSFDAPNGRRFSAVELSAMALRSLAADAERHLGEKLGDVLLTVPANFLDAQRRDMKDVAERAGLDLLGLVHEPTAAAAAYALDKEADRLVLVYDLGGGTFDTTLLVVQGGSVEVLATEGIAECGGENLLDLVEALCLEQFEEQVKGQLDLGRDLRQRQELRRFCELAKKSLSARKETTVTASSNGTTLVARVTQDAFQARARPLLQRTLEVCDRVLAAGGVSWEQPEVVLVGGPSRMPLLSSLLKERTGKEPRRDVDPDHAVARGAALIAAVKLAERGQTVTAGVVAVLPPAVNIQDVAPHPLGCLALEPHTGKLRCAVITPRNDPLPSRRDDTFGLEELGQQSVEVVVVQGEEGCPPEGCHEIGKLQLDLDPKGPKDRRVKVAYAYDQDGVVHVDAVDLFSGKSAKTKVHVGGKEGLD